MKLNGKLWGLLLILSLAQVGRAQLQCYICDDCPEVNANTPQMHCDEDFFNTNGNTEPSTQTTTDVTTVTTEMPTEMPSSSTTTEGSTTVTQASSESTTSSSTSTTTTTTTTEQPTTTERQTTSTSSSTTEGPVVSNSTSSTNSSTSSSLPTTTEQSPGTTETSIPVETTTTSVVTETSATSNTTGNSINGTLTTVPLPPTPSTVHPTSSIPTPPNPERETLIDDTTKYNVNGTESDHGIVKPYIASSQFRLRQTRAVSEYSYHCFKVNAKNGNGTMMIQRGCSRVKATESVCGHWKGENPSMENVKCYPCSNNLCNGSTTLNISLGALAIVFVAVFLQKQ